MLRSLIALLLLVAPFARGEGYIFSADDATVVVSNALTLAAATEDSSASRRLLQTNEPVNPTPVPYPFPEARASGNYLYFASFDGCAVGNPYTQWGSPPIYLSGTDATFECSDVVGGRTLSSTSMALTRTSGDGPVTHTFTKALDLNPTIRHVSWTFAMRTVPSSPNLGVAMFDVTYQFSSMLVPASVTSKSLVQNLPSNLDDGQWKRYSLHFEIPYPASPPVGPVSLTMLFTHDTNDYTEVEIDEVAVRYTRFIQVPTGDPIFEQNMEGCAGVTDVNQVEPALNTISSNSWSVDSAVLEHDIGMKCDHEYWNSAEWSVLMSQSAEIPAQGTLTRLIRRYLDGVQLVPGKEITIEFWMKYAAQQNEYPANTLPTVRVAIDMAPEGGTAGVWRSNPAFHGDFLPGPYVIDDGTDYQNSYGFFRYRTVFQWNGPEARTGRLEFSINRPSTNEASITGGGFWIDDIRVWYTSFEANVFGDPAFVGLYNQHYQVHGIDGGIYNLVSSPTTQVNSRFVFLNEGKCPIFNGIPAQNCWAHPGSYLGAVSIQEIVDGVTHKLVMVAGPAQQGFESVELDGVKLLINDTVAYGDTFDVTFAASHVVMVSTADFAFTFENSDMFINQGVVAQRPLSLLTCHGLFGQTHKRKVYPSKWKYIEGDVDDYLISDNDLFGTDFVYNQFHAV